MFADLLEYDWMLKPVVEFESTADLLLALPDKIISPAEKRVETRQAKLGEIFSHKEAQKDKKIAKRM